MDAKLFLTIFVTVFFAELGDKTQLATMLYAADKPASRWLVFAASATALVLAAGIGVLAGSMLSKYLDPKLLQKVAGFAFILVGLWTLKSAW